MKSLLLLCGLVWVLVACASSQLKSHGTLEKTQVLDLEQMRTDTEGYDWFDFKPGVKKLILSGTPATRHVSVLWYWYDDQPGKVPLHYHAQTESIYVIDGSQADAKGVYPRGAFYFNPPSSGHDIFDSHGLFLLSYAAPPDFTRTAEIQPYENQVVSADYGELVLVTCADGSQCYTPALDASGGMASRFTKLTKARQITMAANVLLVLEGECVVETQTYAAGTLLVAQAEQPLNYWLTGSKGNGCLLFSLTFI